MVRSGEEEKTSIGDHFGCGISKSRPIVTVVLYHIMTSWCGWSAIVGKGLVPVHQAPFLLCVYIRNCIYWECSYGTNKTIPETLCSATRHALRGDLRAFHLIYMKNIEQENRNKKHIIFVSDWGKKRKMAP